MVHCPQVQKKTRLECYRQVNVDFDEVVDSYSKVDSGRLVALQKKTSVEHHRQIVAGFDETPGRGSKVDYERLVASQKKTLPTSKGRNSASLYSWWLKENCPWTLRYS